MAGVPSSPSVGDVSTFQRCPAQYWFQTHQDETGRLPTDKTALLVGKVVHAGAAALTRALIVARKYRNPYPDADDAYRRIVRAAMLDRVDEEAIDLREPKIAARFRLAQPGLRALTETMLEEFPSWAEDPLSGHPFVWAEKQLSTNPGGRGVEVRPGFATRTQPDLIGLRGSPKRVFIRDLKAQGRAVQASADMGLAVRAWWAVNELLEHRNSWFTLAWTSDIDDASVDVEIVNLLHAGETQFQTRHVYDWDTAAAEVANIRSHFEHMAELAAVDDGKLAQARPSGFCAAWCPFLHRCTDGQSKAREVHGSEYVRLRIAGAILGPDELPPEPDDDGEAVEL